MTEERIRAMPRHRLRAITDTQREEICERLLILWKQHPELRLMELLATTGSPPYSMEDYDVIAGAEKFYE